MFVRVNPILDGTVGLAFKHNFSRSHGVLAQYRSIRQQSGYGLTRARVNTSRWWLTRALLATNDIFGFTLNSTEPWISLDTGACRGRGSSSWPRDSSKKKAPWIHPLVRI